MTRYIACLTFGLLNLTPGLAQTVAPAPAPAAAAPARLAGAVRSDREGVKQVWVPAGRFRMGLTDSAAQDLLKQDLPSFVRRALPSEQPEHLVSLSSGYWIDQTEVTNAAYAQFVRAGGYRTRRHWSEAGWAWLAAQPDRTQTLLADATASPNLPRVQVTWYEAQAYAHWRGGTLPTEAQWEYAARGPDSLIYPWGNTFDPGRANVVGSTGLQVVGRYPAGASWVGALDLAGNAMEWVQDWLDREYYRKSPAADPPGPATGSVKIEKGGWWGSNAFVARSSYRHFEDPPDYADGHIGFRIVSSP